MQRSTLWFRARAHLAGATALLALTAGVAAAEKPAPPPSPAVAPPGSAPPTAAASAAPTADDDTLTGHDIYEKVLDNRFDSYKEELIMRSGDRGGNVQATEMELKYKSFRDEGDRFLSKVIMKYQAPQDVRHLGYLVINKTDGSEDQFVYRPSSRRVQRINLRGEAIFGTDFAFEDIIPQEIEDATYERKPDEQLEGTPVYVVQVTPKPTADSEYSKLDVYVARDSFVALKVRYWDQDGLEIKELNADPTSIAMYEHADGGAAKQIWVARKQKVVHLRLESWTELEVTELDPSIDLSSRHFSERQLTSSH